MSRVLLLAIAVETVLFSTIGPNFLTLGNFFEVLRLSVELGLIAVALTPVLVTGGIDLSVGSMLGLAAVVFGAAFHEWHWPIAAAATAALLVGAAGGALNATLVAGFGIPPLIVTLGTLSMFRGIAEGMTHAAVNYSGFPSEFLRLGQGYFWGVVPTQVPLFALVFAAYVALLHRSVVGRAAYAIGLSSGSAQYAGIPVGRRVALFYVLSGLTAGLAAIIYVAHLGQAKSDAGTGYELDAITAVVTWRDIGIRRARHDVGHAGRLVCDCHPAERATPRGSSIRARWCADRDAAHRHHPRRSSASNVPYSHGPLS